MAFPLLALAGPLIKGLFGVIDQVVEDKDEANSKSRPEGRLC